MSYDEIRRLERVPFVPRITVLHRLLPGEESTFVNLDGGGFRRLEQLGGAETVVGRLCAAGPLVPRWAKQASVNRPVSSLDQKLRAGPSGVAEARPASSVPDADIDSRSGSLRARNADLREGAPRPPGLLPAAVASIRGTSVLDRGRPPSPPKKGTLNP
ncbi:hypothetical protein SAT01_16810 [Sinomonas atrocyanea]|nr:hypothetical protein SAT01_16810 [Sinomonas atrocyanea]GGG57483.1 hypothetical protein GCM10007172_05420 [Sinomonas atrocyanea]